MKENISWSEGGEEGRGDAKYVCKAMRLSVLETMNRL
jgi:hypothetical protein